MVSSRKRGRQEMEALEPLKEASTIDRIRNMWEFANLAQWIFIFGKAVKIDENLDIEDLEMECLKSQSTVLSDVGLALLKFVSSHRGLTLDLFDEYTRRQYVAKAPHRNPYGTDEIPAKFSEFDIYTKIRVLQQITQWTMGNPDRIRERMDEQRDIDQTFWRIEPFGWDSEDRTYIVLDDNRLYRQTEALPVPPPAPAPKKGSKKAKAALRASKRRKVSEVVASDDEAVEDPKSQKDEVTVEYDGFGGMKWECLAITLEDLETFIASIEKSRDENEKMLRKRIVDDLLPLLAKQEEARQRKAAQKERELLNIEKLASAKRSSRIAGKLEHQRQEDEAREADRKKQADLAMAKKEQDRWAKLEKERESRMQTREQRLKEREVRRILHEEELAGLSEDSKKLETGEGRLSERHLKAEIERKKQALEELTEGDDWFFDCICGAHGQVDDGTLSIACEKCNVWQHTKCVGVHDKDAERDDFHFVCKSCIKAAKVEAQKLKEAEEKKNRPIITIKLGRPSSSSSAPISTPILPPPRNVSSTEHSAPLPQMSPTKQSSPHQSTPSKAIYDSPYSNGHTLPKPPQFQKPYSTTSGSAGPRPESRPSSQGSAVPISWSPQFNRFQPPSSTFDAPRSTNGQSPFSSPHPHSPTSLPPPLNSQSYSFANGNLAQNTTGSPGPFTASPPGGPYSYSRPVQTPGNRYPSQPPQIMQNGQHAQNGGQSPRRVSTTLFSPLASTPILNPSPSYTQIGFPKPTDHQFPDENQMTAKKPIPQTQSTQPEADSGHSSALPPAFTGISPTKHSPPRPTTSNGFANLMFSTPSVLPPVTSLSPSPQQQILTPPVKHSEPERPITSGKNIGF